MLFRSFKLAVAKEIDVDTNLYGKRFSAVYLSRFMDAYREYKQKTLKTFELKEKKQKEMETHAVVFSGEGIFNVCMEYIRDFQDIPIGFPADRIYDFLLSKTLIDDTDESIQTYVIKAKQVIENKVRDMRLRGSSTIETDRIRKTMSEPATLNYDAKRLIVIDFFQKEIEIGRAHV